MGSTRDKGSSGMFQPIWKAAPGRRNAAIIALIGMFVIALAAFLPAYGKTGDSITEAAVSAVNVLGNLLGVDLGLSVSFTLFEACQTNIVVLILFEIAIALGFIFPFLTETELEIIPAAFLAGIHIYVCVNAESIYAASYSSGLAGVYDTGEVSIAVSLMTPGFILSMTGLVILVIGIVFHFVKGRTSRPAMRKTGVSEGKYYANAASSDRGDPGSSSSGRDDSAPGAFDGYAANDMTYAGSDHPSEVDKTQSVTPGAYTEGGASRGRSIDDGIYGSSGNAASAGEPPYGKAGIYTDDITYPVDEDTYAFAETGGRGSVSSVASDDRSNRYRGSNMYQSGSNFNSFQSRTMEDLYSGDPDEETNILGGASGDFPGRSSVDADRDDRTQALHIQPPNQPVATLKRLNTGEILSIYEGDSIIGRSRTKAQLIVSSAAVSGVHARLSAYHGECAVTDLGSTNGTFINGERISANVRSELKDGDYLSLGAEILEFHVK